MCSNPLVCQHLGNVSRKVLEEYRDVVRRKTGNGWTFWRYERAPGDWVLLDELRR